MHLAFNQCDQPYKEKAYIYIPNNNYHSVVSVGVT